MAEAIQEANGPESSRGRCTLTGGSPAGSLRSWTV